MNRIFLGRAYHWLALIAAFAVMAVVGLDHLHTSFYNLFAAISFAVGLVLVLVVVLPHRPGERVTRDPIEIPQGDEEIDRDG